MMRAVNNFHSANGWHNDIHHQSDPLPVVDNSRDSGIKPTDRTNFPSNFSSETASNTPAVLCLDKTLL